MPYFELTASSGVSAAWKLKREDITAYASFGRLKNLSMGVLPVLGTVATPTSLQVSGLNSGSISVGVCSALGLSLCKGSMCALPTSKVKQRFTLVYHSEPQICALPVCESWMQGVASRSRSLTPAEALLVEPASHEHLILMPEPAVNARHLTNPPAVTLVVKPLAIPFPDSALHVLCSQISSHLQQRMDISGDQQICVCHRNNRGSSKA